MLPMVQSTHSSSLQSEATAEDTLAAPFFPASQMYPRMCHRIADQGEAVDDVLEKCRTMTGHRDDLIAEALVWSGAIASLDRG